MRLRAASLELRNRRHDAPSDPTPDPRAFLRALFDAAVARRCPAQITARFLPPPPKGRTLVLGAGKAGGAMAAAVDALWPTDAPLSGLVVTRYDHVPPAYKRKRRAASRWSRPRTRCPTRPGGAPRSASSS